MTSAELAKFFGDRFSVVEDIYQKYIRKNIPITFDEYIAFRPDYTKTLYELSDAGIFTGYDSSIYIELLEPYLTFTEQLIDNNNPYLIGDLAQLVEDLQEIEIGRTKVSTAEERDLLDQRAGKIITRAFEKAKRGSYSLENDRRQALLENYSYDDKILRLEKVIVKSGNVTDYLEKISEFISKPAFRSSNNSYLNSVIYQFRHNIIPVLKRLQRSLNDAQACVVFYDQQNKNLIRLRKIVNVLNEDADMTNIGEVSDKLYYSIADDIKGAVPRFFFPDYLLDSENEELVNSVVSYVGLSEPKEKKPSIINISKKVPPKCNLVTDIPSDDLLFSGFKKQRELSLFDYVFTHSRLKDKPIGVVYKCYVGVLRVAFRHLQSLEECHTLTIGTRNVKVKDFKLKQQTNL